MRCFQKKFTYFDVETLSTPDSSSISKLDYDIESQQLRVTFISGERYIYYRVSVTVFRAFEQASSKGRFFQKYIRNRYKYKKL